MKRSAFGLLTLVLLSGLTACRPEESPEKAAQEWMQAFVNRDRNIANRTCAAEQATVQHAGLWNSIFNLFTQPIIDQQRETDVSGLTYTTISSSGNTATVRVAGQASVPVLPYSHPQWIDDLWRMQQEDGEWKWCGQIGSFVIPIINIQEIPPSEH